MRLDRSKLRVAALGLLTAGATTAAVALATPVAATGQIHGAGNPHAIAGSYIVALKAGATASATGLAAKYGASVGHTYGHALRGFEARVSQAGAMRLAADPAVESVTQNSIVWGDGTQSPVPSWGLDRIDQRNLPLNNTYNFPDSAGAGVTAYIIDTGIEFGHADFGGRAVSGFDAVDGGSADDCHGHGTHVAGTVGGTSFGVAKAVRLVAVRVLGCDGSGTFAGVIAGIDWVTGDHDPGERAVANMSLGGSRNRDVDNAVTASIADGVSYAVSAGNSNTNACNQSPARTPNALTVGATAINDQRASFSNIGRCLDLFAPGVNIVSARLGGGSVAFSGTSMSSPHVAGAAALILGAGLATTPAGVTDLILGNATAGVVGNPGARSPNLLLYTGFLN
jgi:subtilisin family serine protease